MPNIDTRGTTLNRKKESLDIVYQSESGKGIDWPVMSVDLAEEMRFASRPLPPFSYRSYGVALQSLVRMRCLQA